MEVFAHDVNPNTQGLRLADCQEPLWEANL